MASSPFSFLSLTAHGLQNARRDASTAVVLSMVVGLTSFGLSAAPRVVNAVSDQALDRAASEASTAQRNITFNRLGRIEAGGPDDPFGVIREQGEALAGTLDADLADSIDGSTFAITSPAFSVGDFPMSPGENVYRYFWFRFQEGPKGSIELIDGTLPAPAGRTTTTLAECDHLGRPVLALPPEACDEVDIPVFQTAVTAMTAQWLDVAVGDRLLLRPIADTADNRGIPQSAFDYDILLEVSGIVALGDPLDDVWMGESRLHQPIIVPGALEGFDVLAQGLLAEEDYDRLIDETRPARFGYEWRFFVDYDAVDSSNAEKVAANIGLLRLLYQSGNDIESPRLTTSIDNIVEQYRGERALAVTYSSLVLVGLTGLAVAVVVVLAALAALRRESNTVLVRSRGASSVQLGIARFCEGLVLFVPASLVGLLAASSLVEGAPPSSPLSIALGVAILFSAVFTLLAVPSLAGDLGRLITGTGGKPGTLRRIVVELTFLALAVGSVLLLRRRGLESEPTSGFDPLLASAPLLASMGAGVLLLRVAPFAARLAAAVGSLARGVVGLIGFRSLARRPLAAQLPAVVILIGACLAVFGAILTNTVAATQESGSWQTVGANYRIEPSVEGSRISPQLTLDAVPEVQATADALMVRAQVNDEGPNIGNIQLLALDLGDYQDVGEGTPVDPDFPAGMLRERSEKDVGTESNPIPIIVSTAWPLATPRVGQTLTLVVDHRFMVVTVEEVRDEFAGLDVGAPFVVMGRERMGLANDAIDISPNRRYVRAPDSISAELEANLTSQLRGVNLISRPDVLAEIQGTPTVTTVEMISRTSLQVAVALSIIAVVAGFALTTKERTRDLGYLRAVGLSRREMTWVTFTEQLPPATLATILGVVLGIGVSYLLSPSLDLSPLTGTRLDLGPAVDWGPIMSLTGVLLGTVVAAAAIYSQLNRDMDLAMILRGGDRL